LKGYPVKSLDVIGLFGGFGSEFYGNLHLFGCPFRKLSLLGHSLSAARLCDGCHAWHTFKLFRFSAEIEAILKRLPTTGQLLHYDRQVRKDAFY
jgi:hypothetical protein